MADFRLRVTYAMSGRLVMLSHLEVARALERAVRRADLPYAVSQGFSPHMKQAFGAALPVGVGGTEEIFDVQLTEYVAPDKALERLRAASAADLMPYEARYITKDVPAASVAYPFSTYRAVIAFDDMLSGEEGSEAIANAVADVSSDAAESSIGSMLAQRVAALDVPESITVVRKKKEKVLVPSEFLVGEMRAHDNVLEFTLEAKKTGSLRPDVLLEAMLKDSGLHASSIMRIRQREKAGE
ncbi:TIGR03936 family radical SAM-associated protein [Slackia sp.]|uniref:TIGR03936 family radical SAM-associated protein n=1 Tax=Slackia sp. TaxID=2049041 RepID=UPI00399948AD